MRIVAGALLLIADTTTIGAGADLLKRGFRRLASDDVVNLDSTYAGKVAVVVNAASKCGNTPQYDGLEKRYQEYGDEGLVVLGFAPNDLDPVGEICSGFSRGRSVYRQSDCAQCGGFGPARLFAISRL